MSLVQSFKGFRFAGTLNGGPGSSKPVVHQFKSADTETLTAGDLLNLQSGEVDLAVNSDANLIGVCNQTVSAVDSTTEIGVIVNPDAVWEVYDTTSRAIGTEGRVTGTTGNQSVQISTTNSQNDQLFVCWPSDGDITYWAFKAQSHAVLKKLVKDAS